METHHRELPLAPITTIAIQQAPPPPPRHIPPSNPQVIQGEAPTVQIPEAFWGIVYETASHMVGHAYKATARDLRAIEERSPKDVLKSAMGMNLTVSPFHSPNLFIFFSNF